MYLRSIIDTNYILGHAQCRFKLCYSENRVGWIVVIQKNIIFSLINYVHLSLRSITQNNHLPGCILL